MGNETTQHHKISSLLRDLSRSEIKVNQRRQLAKELAQRLSNHDVRKRLSAEIPAHGDSDYSIDARRCRALSGLWSAALSRSIQVVNDIVNQPKNKCTIDDFRLPDKILRASSQPDDAFDGNGLGITKLSKKSIRSALKFCLYILKEQKAPEGAEQILVDMLAFLCSKDEYMGCFKFPVDFRDILSEILYHLKDDMIAPAIFESASKAFGNFFFTCNRLGIDVHTSLSDSLHCFSDWCEINLKRDTVNSSSCSRHHFFNAAACMLNSHPEYSIGPMKRYGRPILRFCKKAYRTAQGIHKEALNRYILAHLFVAQVAGKIQGLVDGDLGDLGSASLTEKQLLQLLDLSISDVVNVFENSTNTGIMSQKKRQKTSNQALWCKVDDRQQLQLELVARLLACSQRIYISREGWDSLENPDEMLEALLKVPSSDNHDEWKNPELPETQKIPIRVLAKSPWMHMILRKLISPQFGITDNTKRDQFGTTRVENPIHPVLEFLANDNDAQESPIPYLAIIGASAELFPAGECWALSPIENWHRLIQDDEYGKDVLWCHGSSAFDLISLLSILSQLLVKYGQPEGDLCIQYWILLVLIKLTETSSVFVQNMKNAKNNEQHLRSLSMEWRAVWETLFRQDLRYISHARFLGKNTLGEIFLSLLTEIISQNCTEMAKTSNGASGYRQSSFIYKQQEHIWNLLLYKPVLFTNVESRAQFELICSVAKNAGLSDTKLNGESETSLRHHLLNLSLCSFKELLIERKKSDSQQSDKYKIIRSIASCILCLVNGNCLSMSLSTASRFAITCYGKLPSLQEKYSRLQLTREGNENTLHVWLLWGTEETFAKEPDLSCLNLHKSNFDPPLLVARTLRDRLNSQKAESGYQTSDFISENDSEKLRIEAATFVREEIYCPSEIMDLSIDSNDNASVVNSLQTGAVKLIFSLLIAKNSFNTDVLANDPDIISFFIKSVSNIARHQFKSEEYLTIARDLLQISQTYMEISCRHQSTVDLSQKMTKAITDCQSILNQYQSERNRLSLPQNNLVVKSKKNSEDEDFIFNSVDMVLSPGRHIDDQNDNGKNKRKAPESQTYDASSSKRTKIKLSDMAPPNYEGAKAIGSLLLAMEPSGANCRLVCESLLGTDIDVDPDYVQGDIDLTSVIDSTNFFGAKEVLLNDLAKQKILQNEAKQKNENDEGKQRTFRGEDSDDLSPIMMLCQAIDLVRKCAASSSRYFMYGNIDCAKVAIKALKSGLTLTSEEAESIKNIISVDDGMYSRPSLRAQRVKAATDLFLCGDDDFHHLFDKFFASSIVKPHFDDPNFFVRRLAWIAAGVASCKLDTRRILAAVKKRRAPVFSGESAEDTVAKFADWYKTNGYSTTEEQDETTFEAEDRLEVMESDSMLATCLLAGAIGDGRDFTDLLYEILKIPVDRPDLEFMSYRALEKIACVRGFANVQELVDIESEGLLAVWLEKIKDTHSVARRWGLFPPSLTSPNSLWFIMLYGRYDFLIKGQFSREANDKSVIFREKSVTNFVRRQKGFIIPFSLLKYHKTSHYQNSSSILNHLSSDIGFKIVLAISGSSEDGESTAITTILRHHIIDIQAMCIVLSKSDDSRKERVGRSIIQSLIHVFSEKMIESKTIKNVPLLFQRILRLVGRSRGLSEEIQISETEFYQAITYLMNIQGQSKKSPGDAFSSVGASLTEVTIYACDKLVKSNVPSLQLDAWKRFVLLGNLISEQFEKGSKRIQLDFFLHKLNEIVLESSLQKRIRLEALRLIRNVLQHSLRLNLTESIREMTPLIDKFIGICFHVHEESQQNLIKCWYREINEHMICLRRSCGYRLHSKIRWDIESYHSGDAFGLEQSTPAQSEHECLVSTYETLHWIMENRESLDLDSSVFANLSLSFDVEHSDLDILGKVDARYFAQNLGMRLRGHERRVTLDHYILGLKNRTRRLYPQQAKSPGYYSSRLSYNPTTIEERLVCAELSQMESILEVTDMNEVSNSDLEFLLRHLCCICNISSSQKVRFALSRCIALLEPRTLVDASGIDNVDASTRRNENSLRTDLMTKCMECLADLLKSPKTNVAMTAVRTLEAILSDDACGHAYSAIDITTQSLIKPFSCKEPGSRVTGAILSSVEVRELMKHMGIEDNEALNGTRVWCWDKEIWTFGRGSFSKFEVWIQHLTSAIIVCCFHPGKKQHFDRRSTRGIGDSFFWNCQRISYLDHVFASAVFPLLILTLSQHEKHNFCDEKNSSHAEENTSNMNGSIALSFESVLSSWIGSTDSINTSEKNDLKHKSISIVVDTLDLLRKVSQDRFLSLKHSAIKYTAQDAKTRLQSPTLWQGVPYGVVLQTDGIVVAEACIEVQRFASALFFLELYYNSQYGKSGGLFEELGDKVSCADVVGDFDGDRDISGMVFSSKIQESDVDGLKTTTMKAMRMASRCYKELGEIELMHAVNTQLSSLNFTENSNNLTVDLDRFRGIPSLGTLQILGSESNRMTDPNNSLYLSLTEEMESLGLEGLISSYIEGVFVQNKDLKEMTNIQFLREKWFQNNLDTQSWAMIQGKSAGSEICGSSLVMSSGKLPNRGYFELVSESLNSFSNSDMNSLKLFLDQSHCRVIDSLSEMTEEQLQLPTRVVRIVDKLRALQDIKSLTAAEVDLSKFDYDQMWVLEVSLKIRQNTLTAIASRYPENPKHVEDLKEHLWKTCDFAVDMGRPEVAESALSRLRFILGKNVNQCVEKTEEILRIRLAEAKVMECRGDFKSAIQRIKQLIRHLVPRGDQNSTAFQNGLRCDAQILCGTWMTKFKTQEAKVILEEYLKPAKDGAKSMFEDKKTSANAERVTKVFIKLGDILANLYDDLLLRIRSKEWEETETRLHLQYQQCLNSKEERLELMNTCKKLLKSKRKEDIMKVRAIKEKENNFLRLEKDYERTNNGRKEIKKNVSVYLNAALQSFLSAFAMAGIGTDVSSSHIFRMISLWFASRANGEKKSDTDDVMERGLRKVPSFRFVSLTNQLFSRIERLEGRNDKKFQAALQNLVYRMCNDHPYHCIAPLIALANGEVDSKKNGVQQIIDEIEESGAQYVRDLLHSYKILISSYNDLAQISTKKYEETTLRAKRKKIRFSLLYPSESASKSSLHRCLNNLPGVPSIITCPPFVRPGKDYGEGNDDPFGSERIAGFEPDFSITESGIHRPKIVMCIGSKGGSFRQLVKGEDDIRQDAIMSQVFTYVNGLMKNRTVGNNSADESYDRKAPPGHTRRRLKLITYTVVPLSPSSGVLEWVEGTLPIFDFIADQSGGRVGAHSRYYPGEWSNSTCRKYFYASAPKEKRKAFENICARYSPSLRFFFLERFGSCELWHIAKMNFTRSVAVSSMVGHILGIGDRHLGNILIDQGSGEVVHIDFGYVFEQGKLLPVPENVPFRLTRNMVDGMGPCGTEGLFVNVAEETISVLRQHVQELLAILSAVVADPLYKWSVNPERAQNHRAKDNIEMYNNSKGSRSDPSNENISQSTAKTIGKIKEKLQGYEDSTSGEQQGVEGQVQLLINSARDPNNLCRMFHGWGPWM